MIRKNDSTSRIHPRYDPSRLFPSSNIRLDVYARAQSTFRRIREMEALGLIRVTT